MEEDIGGQLFERTTKKVELTELGTKLFSWFSKTESEFKAIIKEYVDRANKHIDICCFEDMDIGTEIGAARKLLNREHPDWEIQYSFSYEYSFRTITKGLELGVFNLAIVPLGSSFPDSKFRTVTLHESDFNVYYYVEMSHAAIIDLLLFDRTQDELVRRKRWAAVTAVRASSPPVLSVAIAVTSLAPRFGTAPASIAV